MVHFGLSFYYFFFFSQKSVMYAIFLVSFLNVCVDITKACYYMDLVTRELLTKDIVIHSVYIYI